MKSGEARTKTAAHRIVGVAVKALVLPEGVDLGRNILRARDDRQAPRHAHMRSENPTMTQEARRDCIADLSASAE